MSTQHQLTSHPRNLRYVFLIDETVDSSTLFEIIYLNLGAWGGRYNPIIPVTDNQISIEYRKLLSYYDPDYVIYTSNIDIAKIQSYQIFYNPIYQKYDKDQNMQGISVLYLIPSNFNLSHVLIGRGMENFESPLLNFYKLNNGFLKSRHGVFLHLVRNCIEATVSKDNFELLNLLIAQYKPFNISELSSLSVNTILLRCPSIDRLNSCEIVISKSSDNISDLLYFWNRKLYECQFVMYLTLTEFEILIKSQGFADYLNTMFPYDKIDISSSSFTQEEIERYVIPKFKELNSIKLFEFKNSSEFPFPISNITYKQHSREKYDTQVLVSENTIYKIPISSLGTSNGKFAADLEIKRSYSKLTGNSKTILYPRQLNTQFILNDFQSRVNRDGKISILISNQNKEDGTINIKNFKHILFNLLHHPWINGTIKMTGITNYKVDDPGNKLTAFVKLFKNDFNVIEDFFSDKFWYSIFSELSKSIKEVGDSITYETIKKICIEVLNANNVVLDENTYQNLKNLEKGMKNTLAELCWYKVLLKGFTLKCTECSSKFWYHINESKDYITCKGCLADFTFPVEPPFSYKLNDLVKNNLMHFDKKQPNGNLTVIRTLAYLSKGSRYSFDFSPQINIYMNNSKEPTTDIDIICCVDGKLIIGEAKHNSDAFKDNRNGNKQLESLVDICQLIQPDEIILSCMINVNNGLEKAEKHLKSLLKNKDYQPKITSHVLYEPDNMHFQGPRYFPD